jgi:Nuclease-related domain
VTRSPIREKPLRQPGQSLIEQRQKIWDDQIEPYLLMALVALLLAGWEWYAHFFPRKPLPWLMTAVAAATVAFGAWRLARLRPRMKALRLGIDGERAVGQYLDRLASKGYRVFHDLQGDSFNVDHVLIGPGGVFTVETKTRSKPERGDARVTYDGRSITVAGFEPERDAVTQAKAQARWLSVLILESTERRQFVLPVVVFPGWYVEAAPGSQSDVWVMEPKGLPAFIEREPQGLSKEDVALISRCLALHMRVNEREVSV